MFITLTLKYNNREIYVNTDHIVSLNNAIDEDGITYAEVVLVNDVEPIAVKEYCSKVLAMLPAQ